MAISMLEIYPLVSAEVAVVTENVNLISGGFVRHPTLLNLCEHNSRCHSSNDKVSRITHLKSIVVHDNDVNQMTSALSSDSLACDLIICWYYTVSQAFQSFKFVTKKFLPIAKKNKIIKLCLYLQTKVKSIFGFNQISSNFFPAIVTFRVSFR